VGPEYIIIVEYISLAEMLRFEIIFVCMSVT